MPVLPSHTGITPVTEKKTAYCRLSSQVLLHPKLGFWDLLGLKKVLKTFLVLRLKFFKSLRPSKAKTKQDQDQNQDLKKWSQDQDRS